MKESTISIVKAVLDGDDSMSDAERELVLSFCRNHGVVGRQVANPSDRWLTPAEVADMLTVSVRTVRRWIAGGVIASRRIGRIRRVPESSMSLVAEFPHVGGLKPTASLKKSA